MTTTTPAPTRCSRPIAPAQQDGCDRTLEDLARLQDVAAARSWASVDVRRPGRRRR